MAASSRPRDSAAVSKSVCRAIQEISNLVLEAGLTVQEVYQLIRENSALITLQRLKSAEQHQSKTRIAISTGLSRAEVARILHRNLSTNTFVARHPIRKLVDAWRFNRRFVSAQGGPKILSIYGNGASFENLVIVSNRGIPVRAMLDQLVHIRAVKLLRGQRVQLIAPLPSFAEIKLVRELLETSRTKSERSNIATTGIRSARKNLKRIHEEE
jgi:hypothetical protein